MSGYSVKHDDKTFDVGTQQQMLDLMSILSHELHRPGTHETLDAIRSSLATMSDDPYVTEDVANGVATLCAVIADYRERDTEIGKIMIAVGLAADSHPSQLIEKLNGIYEGAQTKEAALDALRAQVATLEAAKTALSEAYEHRTEQYHAVVDVLLENAKYTSAHSLADNVRGAIIDVQTERDDARTAANDATQAANVAFAMRDTMTEKAQAVQDDFNASEVTTGKLYAMVQRLHAIATNGHDHDVIEVTDADKVLRAADDLIGVPPEGDVSAPASTTESVSMDMLHVGATENKRLRDTLADMIECAEVSADFDMLEPSDEIAPGGYTINPAYKVLENARALVEGLPLPFETNAASEHAPDDLEVDDTTKNRDAIMDENARILGVSRSSLDGFVQALNDYTPEGDVSAPKTGKRDWPELPYNYDGA